MQTQQRSIGPVGHGSMPDQVPDWDLVPLAPNARGFVSRLPAVTEEELHSMQLQQRRDQRARTALIGELRILSPQATAEAGVETNLAAALNFLRAALRSAEEADYGDQFRGSLDEAIAQVEYSAGML